MTLKLKTAGLFFIVSLGIIPLTVEFLLRNAIPLTENVSTDNIYILADEIWPILLLSIVLISFAGYK